tara:strand:+ start:3602 stop:4075 length:474 start_codon:yes stop_codon:yes gene_type:complete
MAELTGRTQIFTGNTTTVDTVQQYPFGTRAFDPDGNEYIYLTGIGSTILGSWVTYDELGITALLVADAIGLVAVAMAIIDSSSKFGWYAISGTAEAAIAANCAADKAIGFETTSGYAGDGKAAGDTIYGAVSREATSGSADIVTVQISYPSVDDNSN